MKRRTFLQTIGVALISRGLAKILPGAPPETLVYQCARATFQGGNRQLVGSLWQSISTGKFYALDHDNEIHHLTEFTAVVRASGPRKLIRTMEELATFNTRLESSEFWKVGWDDKSLKRVTNKRKDKAALADARKNAPDLVSNETVRREIKTDLQSLKIK